MSKTQTDLKKFIVGQIEKSGPMALGTFISHAMVHPEYGYYTNHDPFGVEGDFTTAPEISQIFGELIGAWVIDIWMQLGKPEFNLIECGPGRGTLMADILRVGRNVPDFTESVHIRLIETQGFLSKKQKQILSEYEPTWHESISDIDLDKPCIIIGNEFLDALPIEQLKRDDSGWRQRVVCIEDDKSLMFEMGEVDDNLLTLLPNRTESRQFYEVSPTRIRFIESCSQMLESIGGAALFIDYGHQKSNYGDTLQAVRNHQFSDVLENVGQSDITSHVDFDSLCRCIQSDQIKKMPINTQRDFLLSLGIEERAKALVKMNPSKEKAVVQDVDRLIGEDQMGNLFKVMCFYKGNLKPCGFE